MRVGDFNPYRWVQVEVSVVSQDTARQLTPSDQIAKPALGSILVQQSSSRSFGALWSFAVSARFVGAPGITWWLL